MAELELKAAIVSSRSEFSKFAEQQRQHARALKTFFELLANHYGECQLAAVNTLGVLTKAEQSFLTSFAS